MKARIARKIIAGYSAGVYNYSQWMAASNYLVRIESRYVKKDYYKL